VKNIPETLILIGFSFDKFLRLLNFISLWDNKFMKYFYNMFFILFISLSANLQSMQSLEEIMEDGFNNTDISKDEVLLTIAQRCSAASFYLNEKGKTDAKIVKEFFKKISLAMAVVIGVEKGDGTKTKEEVELDNTNIIEEYITQYKLEDIAWFNENDFPKSSNSDPTEYFSDFFNRDMVYCLSFWEKWNSGA